jgi:cytochrome c5
VFETLKENGVEVGFSLVQDFRSEQWPRPCNYFYRQRFDFFNDGRFRPWSASYGRGCGDGATYRPVTRIEFANMTNVASQSSGAWSDWKSEDWKRSRDLVAANDGAKLRFSNVSGTSVLVRANDGAPGARNDGRTCASCHDKPIQPRADSARSLGLPQTRGDDALLYVSIHPSGRDEGASDMPPIGTCCNDDHKQGPHRFVEPKEPIDTKTGSTNANAPLVLWYVAQMVNDARQGHEYCWADFVIDNGVYVPRAYPCYSGPTLFAAPANSSRTTSK